MSILSTQRSRVTWLVVATTVLTMFGSLATPALSRTHSSSPRAPLATPVSAALDLAAMSLNPADLDATGLAGYGEFGSAMLTLDEQARQVAPELGLEVASVQSALRAAGFQRRYQRELAFSPSAGTPAASPDSMVTSYIAEYDSPEGAQAGFALLESEAELPRIKDVPQTAVIGEESEITRIRGSNGNREPYRALDLTFRAGNLVGGVTTTSFGDQEPDLALVAALGNRLLDKLHGGSAAAPGLSNLVLRLGGPGVETRADGYGRLAGETFPSYAETGDELAGRVKRYGDAVDVYGVAQGYARGAPDRTDDARYAVLLYRFPSEADAENWLGEGVDHALDTPNVVSATPVADAATIGDKSLTLAMTTTTDNARTFNGYLIDTRVGAQVAQVQILSQPAPPLAAVEDLARAQVDCLLTGACADRAAPPADLAIATPAPPIVSTAGPCGSAPPLATPVAPESAAAGSTSASAKAIDGGKRPNIILILTDDLDSRSVACMPNIQSLLAGQGMTFTNAFVTTPLCCPSRASILRGQYAHNHGVINNSGLDGGFPEFYRRDDESSTIATWLHDAGYRTALFGKYLNRYPREASPTYIPPGWDAWSAFVATTGDDRSDSAYYDYTLNTNGDLVHYGDQPDDYSTDVLRAQATDFITAAADSGQQFFVYLAPFAPHGPPTAAPRFADAFADAGAPRAPSFDEADVSDKPAWVRAHPPLQPDQIALIDDRYRRRLGSLLAVDEMVASLIETLRETGALDSTYIVFASDNGYHLGEHRLPVGKQSAYDEATHVPLIVRGPGIPSRVTTSQLALNIDLAPTFADLAGVAPTNFVDGRSLAPLLRGDSASIWRQGFLIERYGNIAPQYWGLATPGPAPVAALEENDEGEELPRISPVTAPPYLALRTDRYLYVEYASGERELYDLAADPYALQNLASRADLTLLDALHSSLEELRTCAAATCRDAEVDLANRAGT